MRVYRTLEFDNDDLQAIIKLKDICYQINHYNCSNQLNMTEWVSFSGNIDKLYKFAEDHLVSLNE